MSFESKHVSFSSYFLPWTCLCVWLCFDFHIASTLKERIRPVCALWGCKKMIWVSRPVSALFLRPPTLVRMDYRFSSGSATDLGCRVKWNSPSSGALMETLIRRLALQFPSVPPFSLLFRFFRTQRERDVSWFIISQTSTQYKTINHRCCSSKRRNPQA